MEERKGNKRKRRRRRKKKKKKKLVDFLHTDTQSLSLLKSFSHTEPFRTNVIVSSLFPSNKKLSRPTMFVSACVCACVSACVRACVRVCVYACTCEYGLAYVSVCGRPRVHVHVLICTCARVYIYIFPSESFDSINFRNIFHNIACHRNVDINSLMR